MPAASCRIMPARSINRCETISASFGFSFSMGRKNRDNRMGQNSGNQWGLRRTAVKPDQVRKYKAGTREKAARNADFRAFAGFRRLGKATGAVPAHKSSSYPAHAGYPVRRGLSYRSLTSLEYWI